MLKFTKMHGLGNDYICVYDKAKQIKYAPKLARMVCQRGFSIGADGLVLIYNSPNKKLYDFRMRIFNSDGSEAEMCGNGIRCVAKFVYDKHLTKKRHFKIQTKSGIKKVRIFHGKMNRANMIGIDMGVPMTHSGEVILFNSRHRISANLKCKIKTVNKIFEGFAISMGNPHFVVFVNDLKNFPVDKYGPLIETHFKFPNRTNVEFVEICSKTRMKQRTWERGVGETLACGTGACATLVAAVIARLTKSKAKVELIGGSLFIEWLKTESIYMYGPADIVYEGYLKKKYNPFFQ